jgi:hypothetical protein
VAPCNTDHAIDFNFLGYRLVEAKQRVIKLDLDVCELGRFVGSQKSTSVSERKSTSGVHDLINGYSHNGRC